jgi:hypothetical protein
VVITGVCAALVMAPWIIRNMTTFIYPVTLSTGLGITLTYTNCDEVYSGDLIGYWYLPCIDPVPEGRDQSEDERILRQRGLDYIKAHRSDVPKVMMARLGRQWMVFKPDQMIALDTFDARERGVSRLGQIMYYAMIPIAVVGAISLRRRRVPLTPLLTVPVIIALVAMATYGSTRFRVPAELVLVVLSSVGAWAMWDRWGPQGYGAGTTGVGITMPTGAVEPATAAGTGSVQVPGGSL